MKIHPEVANLLVINNIHKYDETVQPTVVQLHIGFDIGLSLDKLENLNVQSSYTGSDHFLQN